MNGVRLRRWPQLCCPPRCSAPTASTAPGAANGPESSSKAALALCPLTVLLLFVHRRIDSCTSPSESETPVGGLNRPSSCRLASRERDGSSEQRRRRAYSECVLGDVDACSQGKPSFQPQGTVTGRG